MPAQPIIKPTQLARKATKAFGTSTGSTGTIVATGLITGESIPVEVAYNDESTFEPAVQNGVPVELTENNNVIGVFAPVLIRIDKPVTTNAVGVQFFV